VARRAPPLEALLREAGAAELAPLRVVPTFLGAHQCPKEFRDWRGDYVRALTREMIPAVARGGLARFCDVFCDEGAFDVAESREVLAAARDHGLGLRVHADELAPSGGARLAAELGAASADHLVHVDDASLDAMAAAGVAPVLLPGTVFSLGLKKAPPARKMVERGLAVAIASDFNPGTSCLWSPLLVIALACQILRLTIAEALTAATANAAASLGLGAECGALLPGMSADAVLIRGGSHHLLAYRVSEGPIERVLARGKMVEPRALAP
jgi:imidazolonepropionase